jgi:NAD(P)-dependent dehydrogenase (short-subunit alcohol dehydrogenase family)
MIAVAQKPHSMHASATASMVGMVMLRPVACSAFSDESVCPSRDLTTTPRQRIVLRREMLRQPAHSAVMDALQMYRRGGGSIVIVGSMRAYYPDPAYYDYCATKAAVTNIAKALSKELGPENIRVNSVSPGPVSTPLWLGTGGLAHSKASGSGQTVDEVVASAVSGAATGRFTTPEQVADLVIFLASDRSANTTGADMRIDGGVVATL